MLWRWSVGDRISIAVVVCVAQSRGLALQVEQEVQRRNLMQGDIKNTSMDLNKAKSKEKQLAKVRTSRNIVWDVTLLGNELGSVELPQSTVCLYKAKSNPWDTI